MESLVIWYKFQFVLSAIFQWLFIPATVGVGLLMAVLETLYLKKGESCYKASVDFWKKIFVIGLAAEIATVIILGLGSRISLNNVLSLAPQIFGFPLLLVGIIALVVEAVFAGYVFCGCKKVCAKANLVGCWLAFAGAVVSAFWLVTVTSWMQHPVGMSYNLDTASYEILDFKTVMFNSFALDRFFHLLFGSLFVCGIAAVGLKKNVVIGSIIGIVGIVGIVASGCASMQDVAACQPVKYSALHGIESSSEPFDEKISEGMKTVRYSIIYEKRKDQFPEVAAEAKESFEENYKYLGFGYLTNSKDAIPPVKAAASSYILMIVFGVIAMVVLLLSFYFAKKKQEVKWMNGLTLVSIPVVYLAVIFGALASEFGKFPWAVYEKFPFTSDLRGVTAGAPAVVIISAILLLGVVFFAVKYMHKAMNNDSVKE